MFSDSLAPRVRLRMSFDPPEGEVTISRIGLLGKGTCACTRPEKHRAATTSDARATPPPWPPRGAPQSVGSRTKQIGMQEHQHEVQRETGEHLPPPDFLEPEPVAALDDRRERDVGRGRGESLPADADHPVLARVLQHRPRYREEQQASEENQRGSVPA